MKYDLSGFLNFPILRRSFLLYSLIQYYTNSLGDDNVNFCLEKKVNFNLRREYTFISDVTFVSFAFLELNVFKMYS